MRQALVIRHRYFESCGTLEAILNDRGMQVRYAKAGQTELTASSLDAVDLLISTGAAITDFDSSRYPWVKEEQHLIEKALARSIPVMAFGLGLGCDYSNVLHWNANTLDLPPGATLLVSTPGVPWQIPLIEPDTTHEIGLVASNRELEMPLTRELFAVAPQTSVASEIERKIAQFWPKIAAYGAARC